MVILSVAMFVFLLPGGFAIAIHSDERQLNANLARLHSSDPAVRWNAFRVLRRYGCQTESQNQRAVDATNASEREIVDWLVVSTLNAMNSDGSWKDASGKDYADSLKEVDSAISISPMLKAAAPSDATVLLAIKMGCCVKELVALLQQRPQFVEDFLNSGSPELHDAAYQWVKDRGYNIGQGDGSHRATWGSLY